MASQDPDTSPYSERNPFHSLLRPTLRQLRSADSSQYLPAIPFLSPCSATSSDLHAAFQLSLPDLNLIALEGPACQEKLLNSGSVSFIFVVEGEVCIEQQTRRWCGYSGDCLMAQGDKLRWSSTDFSIVCLTFPEHQHHLHVQKLKRQIGATSAPPPIAIQPAAFLHKDGEDVACLLRALHLTLCIISDLQISCPRLLPHLRIGDQLGNLTAMLATPELRQSSKGIATATSARAIKEHSILDNLVDYIDSHLSEDLSLNALEAQSHYSRRTLQYAFRAQYGCTVTQWIRSRRLDLAHRRLSLGAGGDSVGDIAKACGYNSMSLFSIEFQQRFHIKPSALLREARASRAHALRNQGLAPDPENDGGSKTR